MGIRHPVSLAFSKILTLISKRGPVSEIQIICISAKVTDKLWIHTGIPRSWSI